MVSISRATGLSRRAAPPVGPAAPTPPSSRRPVAGSPHGASQVTSRVPPPVSQRCSSRTSSASAPRSGPGPGSTVCAPVRSASTTGIGATPRRATPAAASRPCRTTASSQPPRPSGRAPTSSASPASAASRWARPSGLDQPGEPVAAAGGRLEALRVGERGDLVGQVLQRGAPVAGDEIGPRRDGGGVAGDVLVPGARRGAPAQLEQRAGAGRGAAGGDALGARPQRDRVEHGVDGLARGLPAAERAERAVARRGDDRQPRERLGRRRHPPQARSGCGSGGCSGGGARRSGAARGRRPPGRARTRSRRPAAPAPPCRGCAGARSPAVK